MPDEWVCKLCKQKADYLNGKAEAARLEAKKLAHEKGETIAIIKAGSLYTFRTAADADSTGTKVFEYISQH